MASLNINSGVSDPFYRYKMPRLIAKVEGKGNGIKTVIVNMTEVAKALARPPTYTTKYFGCELGAQTNFDVKHDRYIVNGSHDPSKLQGLLDGFVKKFVLCQNCQNPETNLIVKKTNIMEKCIACGHCGQVDMTHKLTTFILKNPPDQDTSATPNKKERRAQKKDSHKKDKDDGPTENGNSESGNSQEQVAAQRASGAELVAPPTAIDGDDDDDDWGDDITDDAVKQRQGELSTAVKGLTMSDDLLKSPQERLDIFYTYIKDKKNCGSVIGCEKDIVAEAERLEVKERCTLLLVELLFNNRIVAQIKEYRALFLRMCHNNHKAQRHLLGGLELLVGTVFKELMPKMPHILKSLYDFDILEEEIIIEWDGKLSIKYVSKELAQEIREKAAPFLNWLKEAEEEEESGDEEKDAVQVVYSNTEKVGTHIEEAKKEHVDDDEDDLDIDDI